MTTVSAYPLTWPASLPRSRAQTTSQFKTSLTGALNNVQGSLSRFGRDSSKRVENMVISSNVTLGAERPTDPGVAVWFTWDGMQLCIAVDRYKTVAENLQAIHHIIEARRTELRHGTLALVRATFTGFQALPSPAGKKSWREVMDLTNAARATKETIEVQYRHLAKMRHPDAQGGSHEKMSELNAARDAALREVGA